MDMTDEHISFNVTQKNKLSQESLYFILMAGIGFILSILGSDFDNLPDGLQFDPVGITLCLSAIFMAVIIYCCKQQAQKYSQKVTFTPSKIITYTFWGKERNSLECKDIIRVTPGTAIGFCLVTEKKYIGIDASGYPDPPQSYKELGKRLPEGISIPRYFLTPLTITILSIRVCDYINNKA
jgi:hypothetical protein